MKEFLEHRGTQQPVYRKLVKKLNNWTKIDCTKQGELLSREAIAEKVWQTVENIL